MKALVWMRALILDFCHKRLGTFVHQRLIFIPEPFKQKLKIGGFLLL